MEDSALAPAGTGSCATTRPRHEDHGWKTSGLGTAEDIAWKFLWHPCALQPLHDMPNLLHIDTQPKRKASACRVAGALLFGAL